MRTFWSYDVNVVRTHSAIDSRATFLFLIIPIQLNILIMSRVFLKLCCLSVSKTLCQFENTLHFPAHKSLMFFTPIVLNLNGQFLGVLPLVIPMPSSTAVVTTPATPATPATTQPPTIGKLNYLLALKCLLSYFRISSATDF